MVIAVEFGDKSSEETSRNSLGESRVLRRVDLSGRFRFCCAYYACMVRIMIHGYLRYDGFYCCFIQR